MTKPTVKDCDFLWYFIYACVLEINYHLYFLHIWAHSHLFTQSFLTFPPYSLCLSFLIKQIIWLIKKYFKYEKGSIRNYLFKTGVVVWFLPFLDHDVTMAEGSVVDDCQPPARPYVPQSAGICQVLKSGIECFVSFNSLQQDLVPANK